MKTPPVPPEEAPRRGGFTLIEIILALGILSLMVGGIYAVGAGAVEVSSKVAEVQQREILVHNFLQLCRRNVEQMPGNAEVLLTQDESVGGLSEIVFFKYPLAFAWSGVQDTTGRVVLLTERNARGTLDVYVLYIEEPQDELQEEELDYDYRSFLKGQARTDFEYAYLKILDGLRDFRWRFYDDTEQEWLYQWEDRTVRPSLIDLEMVFYPGDTDTDRIRTVYWAPVVANPEQLFARGGGGGGGARGREGEREGDGERGGRGGRDGGDGRGGGEGRGGGARGSGGGAGGGRGGGGPSGAGAPPGNQGGRR